VEDEDEEQTKIIEVVCATEGCSNAGIPIQLEVPESIRAVFCGVCGQRIIEYDEG